MNQYERKNAEQIKEEISQYEQEKGKMPKEKKAYYIYRRMGQIYSYKEAYFLFSPKMSEEEYSNRVKFYKEGTTEEGEAICIDMNKACAELMKEEGIEASIHFVNENDPLSHVNGSFEANGKYYFFNLTPDVMRIQTGMKTRNFGMSQELLKRKLSSRSPRNNQVGFLEKMNKQNHGNKFSEITEKAIAEWDKEFGFSYKGLYTNDILELMEQEAFDEGFMRQFFGTNKPDELAQRKFEFLMKYVGIMGKSAKKKIGNVQAMEYYLKLSQKVLTIDERVLYIKKYDGFIEENGRRKAKNIVIIKKQMENVYYLYDPEKQIYERVDKDELLGQNIKFYVSNTTQKELDEEIKEIEGRIVRKQPEEMEL